MPTLNLGTDDSSGSGGIPYWKQPYAAAPQLPPPAVAAAKLKAAGEAIFAPMGNETDKALPVEGGCTDAPDEACAEPCVTTMKVATIGTDNVDFENTGEYLRSDGPGLDLAKVAGHMRRLQGLLHNEGRPIGIDAFETITDIGDSLDQVYYWGIAESRFPEKSLSVLCECEVIETLSPILLSERPALVEAALRALGMVLHHPACRLRFSMREGAFDCIFSALTRFPAKVDLIADAIALCQSAACEDNIEEFLSGDCLSGVIAAMKRHKTHFEIQKRGVSLFASIIGMRRRDPSTVPISILFVHIGDIVDFVLAAAFQQSTSSDVAEATAHFFEIATSAPENILKLLRKHNFLTTVERVAKKGTAILGSSTIVSALATIANVVPALPLRGKMRLATLIRDVMIRESDVSVLTTCFALQHALLLAAKVPSPAFPEPPAEDDEDPSERQKTTEPSSGDGSANIAADYEALKQHMTEEKIPQCMLIAMDHFGEDGDQLHCVGSGALREMAMRRFHWQ